MSYRIDELRLVNWRNFATADLRFDERAFLIGANASGKSNLLDSVRFLHDIAVDGLQRAVEMRDGISMIRCLWARRPSNVEILIKISDHDKTGENSFEYRLALRQNSQKEVYVEKEVISKNGEEIVSRPDKEDAQDPKLRSQTHLEQISKNKDFREISDFLSEIGYLHLVPQIIKDSFYSGTSTALDPYGSNFLHHLAHTRKNTRDARLRRISNAIKTVVPPLDGITYEVDIDGKPHLSANFQNWRGTPAKHLETHLSDGTIRLIGLLWAILSARGLLLLEEPELSLHSSVIRSLPGLLSRMQRETKTQIIISTHSSDLLWDKSILPKEVFLLIPQLKKPTQVIQASEIDSITRLMGSGLTAAEVALPYTKPQQLELFDRALSE